MGAGYRSGLRGEGACDGPTEEVCALLTSAAAATVGDAPPPAEETTSAAGVGARADCQARSIRSTAAQALQPRAGVPTASHPASSTPRWHAAHLDERIALVFGQETLDDVDRRPLVHALQPRVLEVDRHVLASL